VIYTRFFDIKTQGDSDVIDITALVNRELEEVELDEGLVTIFVSGSTAGLTTIEFEPGLVKDIRTCFERLIPQEMQYHHEDTWHDGNGHSHIRSALLKTSFAVPILDHKLLLGTWQQVILVDFDNRPRTRRVVAQFVGKDNQKR
jgi:secondary thiamine-phosphate synthase enzyme